MGNTEKIVLCDTDVLLEFYKGTEEIVEQLRVIQQQNIRISVITSMEIVFGALNKQEL